MATTRPREATDSSRISGANADVTVKASGGMLIGINITVAGDATSAITLYNGAITGTAIEEIIGTATGYFPLWKKWCGSGIHAVSVNPNGAMRATLYYK